MRVAEELCLVGVNLDILPSAKAPAAWNKVKAATFQLWFIYMIVDACVVKVLLNLLIGESLMQGTFRSHHLTVWVNRSTFI